MVLAAQVLEGFLSGRVAASRPAGLTPAERDPVEMSGNCWEWTRSLWGDYPYPKTHLDAPRELRVLRGGGFNLSRRRIRCAFRSRDFPVILSRYIGFRVVVRPLL